ncbi:hypothetical protein EK904_009263 [Melospiza melodia maxima]|nr:hypothetical protein EK904_009263 [Melospiza melodia maxima]
MNSQGILISCKMQKLFREQKSVLPFLCKCLSLESNYAPIFSFLWQYNQRTAIQMNVFSAYPKFCLRCLKPLWDVAFFAISVHSIKSEVTNWEEIIRCATTKSVFLQKTKWLMCSLILHLITYVVSVMEDKIPENGLEIPGLCDFEVPLEGLDIAAVTEMECLPVEQKGPAIVTDVAQMKLKNW